MGKIHKDFQRGKRVLVMLRNEEKIVGKFVSNDSRGITLDHDRHIDNKNIRAITILKGGRRIDENDW